MLNEIQPWSITLAFVLVLAGIPAGIGLVGTAAAQSDDDCRPRPFAEEGFIAVSNPAGDAVTATEAYGVAETLSALPDDEARNGVDAYEIDLGCEILASEVGTEDARVCVDPYDRFGGDEDPNVIKVWEPPETIERRDFEVTFRDSLYREVDAEDPTPVENCQDGKDLPADTRYVVIYLSDGLPRGAQLAGSTSDVATSGPYTAWFCAKIGPADCA